MIKYYDELEQGSDAWLMARLGLLTASEMKLIVTEKQLKLASNDKSRAHVNEIAAQRITQHVEPSYISDDMMRGSVDEIEARELYQVYYNDVKECGFITNDEFGFTLGFSPDGLIDDDGIIEIKSRRAKHQIETIVKNEVPSEYMLQIQTGLLVSGRSWCDFISYSGGLPMFIKRVKADKKMQDKIIACATDFENKVTEVVLQFQKNVAENGYQQTERKTYEEVNIT